MSRPKFNPKAPIQPVNGASRLSGLSRAYILRGCKDGKIPYIKVGEEYRVDMVLWMQQLHQQAEEGVTE